MSNYGSGGDPSNRGIRNSDEPFATVTSKVDRVKIYEVEADESNVRGMLSAGGNNTAGQRERPPTEPSATITGKGTAYWQVDVAPEDATFHATNIRPNSAGRNATQPAPTLAFGHETPPWSFVRPSTTVNCDARISKPGRDDPAVSGSQQAGAIRVTPTEAGILQSFRRDYPWQGTRTKQYEQAGNAIPVGLAQAVLAQVALPVVEELAA